MARSLMIQVPPRSPLDPVASRESDVELETALAAKEAELSSLCSPLDEDFNLWFRSGHIPSSGEYQEYNLVPKVIDSFESFETVM